MNNQKIVLDIALLAVANVTLYFTLKYILSNSDPAKKKSLKKSNEIMARLGRGKLDLSEHEQVIAAEVVHPDDLTTTFDQIGGLEQVVDSLQENVIYPLRYPEIYSSVSSLLGAPKGVLLYGPPGCGKTMLAKALAKESGASFINLHVSTLTDKWFGESQKLVSALFSLAKKLEPTIIFIDEIDSFLRERKSMDHEATSMMKAEFMSLWDGLATSGNDARVLVLGATNRPNDIDKAILRRMPKRFHITLPNACQRNRILSLLLESTALENGFDMRALVAQTNGFSGSDLREMCRNAVMIPVREAVRGLVRGGEGEWAGKADIKKEPIFVRRVTLQDFFACADIGITRSMDGTLTGSIVEDLD